MIGLLQSRGIPLPVPGPVLIAVSGGVDSMVLAHLLGRYGRKVAPPDRITLLHLDHGWRPESATVEREAVRDLARSLGTGFLARDLEGPAVGRKSANLEEDGRIKRTGVYDELAGPGRPFLHVLTAHHRDDLAETVLFRFLRGEFDVGREGILFEDPPVLRPFLGISKEQIRAYALEEAIPFHEDSSNQDRDFFRGWVREAVFPMIETRYPSIRETLARYALERRDPVSDPETVGLANLLQAIRGPLNRAQRGELERLVAGLQEGAALSLPGGVQLKRLKEGWLIENADRSDRA